MKKIGDHSMSILFRNSRFLPVVAWVLLMLHTGCGSGRTDLEVRAVWLKAQNWQRDTALPCVALGEDGMFDSMHVHGPCVFQEDGRYVMFYTGASEPVYERAMSMGVAFSRDGKTFEKHPDNPLLSLEGRQITTPAVLRNPDGSVLREDGRLRLWFTATGVGEDRQRTVLMETSSEDGLLWAAPRELDLEFAYAPSIIKDGSVYKMWFADTREDPWPIRYADSDDGTHWNVRTEPVLVVDQGWERKRLFYPTVLRIGEEYLMWYGSYRSHCPGEQATTALGFAVSADGFRWKKNPHNPVFSPDPSRVWESHYTTCQTVLPLSDGSWRIWYASRPKPPFDHKYFAIGTARWDGPLAAGNATLSKEDRTRRQRRRIRVAGIMNTPVREGNYKEKNFQETESLIRQAAGAGAELVCTYEQFLDGYGFDANKITDMNDERVNRYEVIGDSVYVERLADLARELRLVIVAGIGIREQDATYNSALVFGRAGQLVGQYRKTYNSNKYARWFAPLSEAVKKVHCPSFDIGPGRISVKICNDRRFRETTAYMVENGCELLLAPSFGRYDPSRLVQDTKEFGVWAVFVHPEGCQFIQDGTIVFEQRPVEGKGSFALYEMEFREPDRTDQPSVAETEAAMKKAATCFREVFARDGGYPRNREPDPTWPEEKKSRVKLEGASPVGLAYLLAYQATGDPYYLGVPKEAAHALVWAQLASGGWHHKMDNDPERQKTFFYRRDVESGQTEKGERSNLTVFDDDLSQSAARLLMLFDKATGFKDKKVHHASLYALSGFMKLQYSSGGWPMWVERSKEVPSLQAHYPESWSRMHPKEFYPPFYTINDAAIPGVVDALLLGHILYGDRQYLESARRGGDFLVLARMPEPQPAWCQQYTMDMTPTWAREFEPPAIASYESVSVISTLMKLYIMTGDTQYSDPIGPALDWLERSRLPDGRCARFYELKTNRPIYFTTEYELVYTDHDLPTHYRFKWDLDLDDLRKQYEGLDGARREYFDAGTSNELRVRRVIDWPQWQATPEAVRSVINAMDDQGRWIHEKYAPGRVFVENMTLLSSYVASHK